MMKTTFIYELIDPMTGETKYIGKSNNIKVRLSGHISLSSRGDTGHKSNWIKELLRQNVRPIECSNGKTYTSTSEAARELSLYSTNISKVCRGKLTHTGGFKFKYIE